MRKTCDMYFFIRPLYTYMLDKAIKKIILQFQIFGKNKSEYFHESMYIQYK